MESFDGLAILTTNLRANIDEAFARRLDAIVDFPMPEEDDRRRLWELNLGMGSPLADDLDLAFLASAVQALRRQHPQHRDDGRVQPPHATTAR